MSRATDLIKAATLAMDKGEDPFHRSFLIENDVTLDEAYDMSEGLATATRIYLCLKENHPDALASLVVEVACGPELAGAFATSLGLERVTKQLRDL